MSPDFYFYGFALVISVMFLGAAASFIGLLLVVLSMALPESERASGVRLTAAVGLVCGFLMAWMAYDSHDIKGGNVIAPFVVGTLATTVSTVLTGLLLFVLSKRRIRDTRGFDGGRSPGDDRNSQMTSAMRHLPPPAC